MNDNEWRSIVLTVAVTFACVSGWSASAEAQIEEAERLIVKPRTR